MSTTNGQATANGQANGQPKAKGWAKKPKSRRVKLTEVDVRHIRKLHFAESVKGSDLAEIFGVSQATISLILSRKTWAWVK